jgi:hypothetical protein
MNHSCQPNCLGTLHGFEVAVRDITIDEQLTNDYGTFADQREDDFFLCHCGAPGCRRTTRTALSAEQATALQAQLRLALTLTPSVTQPLAPLLEEVCLAAACVQAAYSPEEAATLVSHFRKAHLADRRAHHTP